jgi:hypothetical protein
MINEGVSTARSAAGAEGATSKISLNDICYEQIKDNFYYGKFGEFKLVIDKNTGCFNATKLCTDGGKEFRQWKRLERVQELIKFYENTRSDDVAGGGFYKIKTGNKDDKRCRGDPHGIFYEVKQANYGTGKLVTGQYVQKEFILDIASWISPAFYFKCSKIVNYFFIELYKKDLELKEQQLKTAQHQIEKEREENDKIKEQLQEAEERALNFQQLAISDIHLEQTQVIYIATSPNYAKQNRFKVGGVKARRCLKGRLGVYNTRSAQGDFFYYSDIFMVFEYRQIEERLKSLLRRFRDKDPKEMYIMYYPDIKYIVKYICDHLAEEVEEVNRKLSEFIFNYVKRGRNAIVPQEIEDWKNEEQDEYIENEEEEIATDLENLRVALIELLNKLPATTTEITKKELFDKLKVRKGRIEKLDHVKQVIAEIRPSLILRERKDRVVKKDIKYPK